MKHGVTLMEMLIALLVVIVVGAVTVPNLVRRMPRMRRNAAVTRIEAELRAARVAAISEARTAFVQIDHTNATLTVSIDRDGSLTYDPGEVSTIEFADPGDLAVTLNAGMGSFTPRGMFSCAAGVWRISVGTPDWGERYLYVFQAGQVVVSDEAQ
jgi:Tfp pilus assembly protein FimT